MANQLWTATQAARSTLAGLRYLSNLPRTVFLDYSTDFAQGVGQTISIRSPISAGSSRIYTATNRTARDAIVFDDLSQGFIDITLEDQVYKAVRLPDDFATFTLQSLEEQVLRPQAESVVDGINAPLITKMNAVATDAGVSTIAADGTDFLAALISARQVLNARKVPMGDRYFAVGPEAEAAALSVTQLQKVNESGGDVLREATLGRLFGFTIVADPNITGALAYHRDAFALITRPSRSPEGAAMSAIASQDGYSLRWLMHYNPLQLEDQSVVDTFVGAETISATRAVKLAMGI